jgi:hypothetical protein
MCYHEFKYCPRCGQPFECKPGNITQCHCFEKKLTADQKIFLEEKYNDCLCGACLQQFQDDGKPFTAQLIAGRG